jgi:hypothetical protein
VQNPEYSNRIIMLQQAELGTLERFRMSNNLLRKLILSPPDPALNVRLNKWSLLMYSGGLYFNKVAIQSKQRRAEEE